MPLFNEDGTLDLDVAREQTDSARLITNDRVRRDVLASLNVAALLDIASSLRVVALEASLAMQQAGLIEVDLGGDSAPHSGGTSDFLVIGDLVRVVDSDEVGEVTRLGFDDGELWAEVTYADGREMRYYTRNLERVSGAQSEPEPALVEEIVARVGIATSEETSALLTDEDEDGDPAVGGYELDGPEAPESDESDESDESGDIDDDFAPVEDPLADLKAKEAARKKGSKK